MTITKQIDDLTVSQRSMCKIANDSKTYYNSETILSLFTSLYGDYICKNFYDNFLIYLKVNESNFIRILVALEKEYDITENYDKYSEITNDIATVTATTEILSPEMTTETKSASFDSENYKNQSKNIVNLTGDNKTINTVDYDKTATDGHNTKMLEHTHGNIGVTTNSQMIKQEYDLRRHDYLVSFLNRFINTFAFYVEGF